MCSSVLVRKKLYLGLCDESVLVVSKVVRAAGLLLIHVPSRWLQPVADGASRCGEVEGRRRDRVNLTNTVRKDEFSSPQWPKKCEYSRENKSGLA